MRNYLHLAFFVILVWVVKSNAQECRNVTLLTKLVPYKSTSEVVLQSQSEGGTYITLKTLERRNTPDRFRIESPDTYIADAILIELNLEDGMVLSTSLPIKYCYGAAYVQDFTLNEYYMLRKSPVEYIRIIMASGQRHYIYTAQVDLSFGISLLKHVGLTPTEIHNLYTK